MTIYARSKLHFTVGLYSSGHINCTTQYKFIEHVSDSIIMTVLPSRCHYLHD
jgi:hypothetical protein